MTKVLHIYPHHDSMVANYVSMLCRCLPATVESMSVDDKGAIRQALGEYNPDIIHLHGDTELKSLPRQSRVVITTHGTKPHKFLATAYVVIARSTIEASSLSDIGVPRLEVIRNPLYTKTTTSEELALKMTTVYQKVMDSNILPLLTPETRQMFSILLKVGLLKDRRWAEATPNTDDVNWHRLFIYAELEGCMPVIQKGIRLMGISAPGHSAVSCYLPKEYQQPSQPGPYADVSSLVADIRQKSSTKQLPLVLLCSLFQSLYSPNLDEAALLRDLESGGLTSFFCSTLQILREQIQLDEGFMPCQPVNNRTTEHLRKALNQHLKL